MARVCFTGETQVKTIDGSERIDEIQEGDYVLSENPETGEKGYERVTRTYENTTRSLVYVSAGGETIESTPEHPYYVEGKGFVEAKNLCGEWRGAGA